MRVVLLVLDAVVLEQIGVRQQLFDAKFANVTVFGATGGNDSGNTSTFTLFVI